MNASATQPFSPSVNCLHQPYSWCKNKWEFITAPLDKKQSALYQILIRIIAFIPLVLATLLSYPVDLLASGIEACQAEKPDFSSHEVHKAYPESIKKNFEEADVFFLAEVHGLPEVVEPNGRLISSFAKKEKILVFFEGGPSGVKLLDEKFNISKILTEHSISTALKNKISCYGWDVAEFTRQNALQIKDLDQKNENFKKCEELKKQLSSSTEAQQQEIFSKMTALEDEIKNALVKTRNTINQTFPLRTDAMIKAIEKLPEIFQKEGGRKKVFFIAGAYHVRDDSSHDLSKFFQTLSNMASRQKNPLKSVILLPKVITEKSNKAETTI